jgi:ribonuclease HI
MNYRIHTDGGARGNPGPAAIGVVVDLIEHDTQSPLVSYGKYIGVTTNNVAEYSAVYEALKTLVSLQKSSKEHTYHFFLDSLLVVNQLNGIFKVKDSTLREYLAKIRIIEQQLGGTVRYQHIPREQNADADLEVNKALDAHVMFL